MTRAARARVVVAAGGGATASGIWAWFGAGPGMVAAGVLAVAYGLVVMDAD